MRFALLPILIAVGCGANEAPPAPSTPAPAEAVAEAPKAPAGKREDVDLDAFAALKEAGGVTVIDVRTDGEFASGHVPGAVHVPLADLSADHPAIKGLPKDQPVYFICQSGGRSSRAADQMAQAGYHTVNVQGGTGGWIAKGLPVE